jgi:hypothetical protein
VIKDLLFSKLSKLEKNQKGFFLPGLYYKAVPLQAWSGPEGSGKVRFPDFMTTTQGVGKVVRLTHWPSLLVGNILISVRG